MKRNGERTTRNPDSARECCQRSCATCRKSVPSRRWRSIIRPRKRRNCISRASTRPWINTAPFLRKFALTLSSFRIAISIRGNLTKAAEYSLTDDTYAQLLEQLAKRKFDLTSPDLRDNILQFYSDLSAPIETKKDNDRWQNVLTSLDQLKSATPIPTVAGRPGAGYSSCTQR